jgi:hypothetical protein
MLKYAPLFLIAFFLGCESQPTTTPLDPDRILHMAGEEAGQIASPRDRLTRQLNIANRETETGKPANARNTLALARKTLEDAGKKDLTDQERLSGWISLSELARAADDKPFANGALDRAIVALNQITPDPARCEYVPGIEAEVRILRGGAEAAKLLRTAADWAMDLPPRTRRSAFVIYTEELFRCNDYDGGKRVMDHEPDAAWRSDALVAMSDRARMGQSATALVQSVMETRQRAAVEGGVSTTEPSEQTTFGKPLDFKSNYYRP